MAQNSKNLNELFVPTEPFSEENIALIRQKLTEVLAPLVRVPEINVEVEQISPIEFRFLIDYYPVKVNDLGAARFDPVVFASMKKTVADDKKG